MMKKLMSVILVLAMALSLAACGSSTETTTTEAMTAETTGNLVAQYMSKGYTWRYFSTDDDTLVILLGSEDNTDYVQVTIPLTEEEMAGYDALDVFSESYDEDQIAWLKGISGEGTVISMNDWIPTQEELDDEFVGKTGAELEEMDCCLSGLGGDDEISFVYSYYKYIDEEEETAVNVDIIVTFDGTEDKTYDDLGNDILNTLTVKSVKFKRLG